MWESRNSSRAVTCVEDGDRIWIPDYPVMTGIYAPIPAAGKGRGEGGRPQVLNTPAHRPTTRPFESLRTLANWLEQMTTVSGVFAPSPGGRGPGWVQTGQMGTTLDRGHGYQLTGNRSSSISMEVCNALEGDPCD